MSCGIYVIENKANGRVYVGSSSNTYKRFLGHKSDLRNGKHHSFILQRAWNKYGESGFNFRVISKCPREYLIRLEQWFIDTIRPEYNISKVAGVACETFSDEHKGKLRDAKLGKPNVACVGEKHPNSRLTVDDVLDIRREYTKGISQHKLAARYGVRQDHISRIINNKVWQVVI